MKRWTGLLLALVLSLLPAGCGQQEEAQAPAESMEPVLLDQTHFDVDAEDLGTYARGRVQVWQQDRDTLKLKLSARIAVGEQDWGGVAFFLPQGCELDGVYYTMKKLPRPQLWHSEGEGPFGLGVELGRSREQVPSGGDSGSVVVEALLPLEELGERDSLTFGVECGGALRDGDVIWGTAWDRPAVCPLPMEE